MLEIAFTLTAIFFSLLLIILITANFLVCNIAKSVRRDVSIISCFHSKHDTGVRLDLALLISIAAMMTFYRVVFLGYYRIYLFEELGYSHYNALQPFKDFWFPLTVIVLTVMSSAFLFKRITTLIEKCRYTVRNPYIGKTEIVCNSTKEILVTLDTSIDDIKEIMKKVYHYRFRSVLLSIYLRLYFAPYFFSLIAILSYYAYHNPDFIYNRPWAFASWLVIETLLSVFLVASTGSLFYNNVSKSNEELHNAIIKQCKENDDIEGNKIK
jgi:hypothetical protein